MADHMTNALQFRLEEFKALRAEIDFYIAEFRIQERNAIIAVGFIWAWLIGNHRTHPLLWAAPMILVLAIIVRSYAMGAHIKVISEYIATTEKAFGAMGWEQTPHSKGLGIAHNALTWSLFLLTLLGLVMRSRLAQ
jgi:hypothetical protein